MRPRSSLATGGAAVAAAALVVSGVVLLARTGGSGDKDQDQDHASTTQAPATVPLQPGTHPTPGRTAVLAADGLVTDVAQGAFDIASSSLLAAAGAPSVEMVHPDPIPGIGGSSVPPAAPLPAPIPAGALGDAHPILVGRDEGGYAFSQRIMGVLYGVTVVTTADGVWVAKDPARPLDQTGANGATPIVSPTTSPGS